MHAVIAAGSAFVIFVTVALYWVCKNSRKESRPVVQTTSASNMTTRPRSSGQDDNETALVPTGQRETEKDLHSTEIS
ncbi:hypothetical protein NP493_563g04004 [Ridgeia piscesae]|uniref:Uncharacterized protein n=1 Tax=Ridgeia piscesae TaxID=27915 RepID=A0AAD9KV43_RIDPI|nr:hypothetical protein NP493_563g04004 [Ridgeia piscesae]